MPKEFDENKYPSIDLAYPIALSTYEALYKRNDAIDTKIQNSLTVSITIFLALVSVGKFLKLSMLSVWFITGSVLMLVSVGINLFARIYGEMRTLNPNKFYQKWLWKNHEHFMKDFIFFSGEDYSHNNKVVSDKWRLHVFSLISFIFALCLLVVWG